MKIIERMASIATSLDALGMTAEANVIDEMMTKLAQMSYTAYYQVDPRTGKARGILHYTDETLTIHYHPEQPVVGNSLQEVKQILAQSAAGGQVQHDAVEQMPFAPTSNVPFTADGRRMG